ncbi:MAG: hypothetical protein OJF48_001899 [Afipia sp.]|nr:MAG: hypothetical protein OJF48_001899 [Afipia sp.]
MIIRRRSIQSSKERFLTLSDARAYVLTLSKTEQAKPHVVAGVKALMLAADKQVCEFVAQVAVAHIVNGPPKPLGRSKPDRPWMKSKPRA